MNNQDLHLVFWTYLLLFLYISYDMRNVLAHWFIPISSIKGNFPFLTECVSHEKEYVDIIDNMCSYLNSENMNWKEKMAQWQDFFISFMPKINEKCYACRYILFSFWQKVFPTEGVKVQFVWDFPPLRSTPLLDPLQVTSRYILYYWKVHVRLYSFYF